MPFPVPCLAFMGLALLWAALSDLRRRRIPNVVTALLFGGGLLVRGFSLGAWPALSGLVASLAVLFVLYVPWSAGRLGGGDVKLAAATAAWAGLDGLLAFALGTAIAGGAVSVVCYLVARPAARADVRATVTLAVLHGEMPSIPAQRAGHPSVPYAVAIAAGAAVTIFVTRW